MTKKVIETVNGWYMENPKQKVELDDIVGLVKIDEPTDSVQLQKEAQLSIYEKRIIELENENEQLKKELKRCRDWLNSDKNDYQLTLAFIKSKGYSLKDVLEYEKELEE